MRMAFKIVLVALIIAVPLLFNRDLIDVRMSELDYLLGKAAKLTNIPNATNILGRYELIKRRIETGERNIDNYEFEARIQVLAQEDQKLNLDHVQKARLYVLPVKPMLRALRLAMGKQLIDPQDEHTALSALELGYLLERNRKYTKAIEKYDQVLTMQGLSPEIESTVLLHKAFCNSMLNDYEGTKQILRRIIHDYPETEASIISWKLLSFLTSIEGRRREVEVSGRSDFDLGKEYYLLVDYRKAIEHLSAFLEENETDTRVPEARYYRGRSHEELGEIDEALDDYIDVILFEESTLWAKEANRRRLMLGEFYDEGEEVSGKARAQASEYQDDSFLDMVEHYSEMRAEATVSDVAIKEAGLGVRVETKKTEDRFGELFIQTKPGGAQITISGEPVGRSPVLLEKVPFGEIEIEAESEFMFAREAVRVTNRAIKRITLRLRYKPGSISITCDEREASVYLDGAPMGHVGSGLFTDIAAGAHRVLLVGESDPLLGLFFLQEVDVGPNQKVEVNADLLPYGTIDYDLPKGTEAKLEGETFEDSIRGRGLLEFVPAGPYRVHVTGEEYRSHSENLDLRRNQIAYFKPTLQRMQDYIAEVEKERGRQQMYRSLSSKLDRLAVHLSSGNRIQEEDIRASEDLLGEIEAAGYDFPSLQSRAQNLKQDLKKRKGNQEIEEQIFALSNRKERLESELSSEHRRQRNFNIASWVSLGIGLGSFGGMGYSIYRGNETYNRYMEAEYTDEAIALREETITYQTLSFITGIVGGLGVTTFTLLQLLMPRPTRLEREVDNIEAQIQLLEERKE
jgi:tetratricopeptide (TPR) repeat protein